MSRRANHLPEVHFDNPRLSKVGVELITLRELRSKVASDELASPQRVEFFLLLLVETGEGSHVVDFVEHRLRAGDVMLVKPGQVQQWRLDADLQGSLVLLTPDAFGPAVGLHPAGMRVLGLDDWPAKGTPDATLFKQSLTDLARVRADIEAFDDGERKTLIIRHALITVMLRLGQNLTQTQTVQAASKEAAIHRLFNLQLNGSLTHRMTVLEHAKRLGYSESTLSRACVQVVGQTAKQLIDRRLALEAKRLLAHSQMPVAHIGHQLGFSESTNFVKFFRRLGEETPQQFRLRNRQVRADA
jgi:AraC-like DNA-binding protein